MRGRPSRSRSRPYMCGPQYPLIPLLTRCSPHLDIGTRRLPEPTSPRHRRLPLGAAVVTSGVPGIMGSSSQSAPIGARKTFCPRGSPLQRKLEGPHQEGVRKTLPPWLRPSCVRGNSVLLSTRGTRHLWPLPLGKAPNLIGTHMRLRDVLLSQPDFVQESPLTSLPWYEPPFLTPSAPNVLETPWD